MHLIPKIQVCLLYVVVLFSTREQLPCLRVSEVNLGKFMRPRAWNSFGVEMRTVNWTSWNACAYLSSALTAPSHNNARMNMSSAFAAAPARHTAPPSGTPAVCGRRNCIPLFFFPLFLPAKPTGHCKSRSSATNHFQTAVHDLDETRKIWTKENLDENTSSRQEALMFLLQMKR